MSKPNLGARYGLALICAIGPAWYGFSTKPAVEKAGGRKTAARFATPALSEVAATIQLQPMLTGLSSPLYVTHAHDGSNRLFIVEQPGRIKVLQPGTASPTVLLDITSKVLSGGERGLLGLTFHPQFTANRRFFVDYTRQTDGATVIAEYHASASNPNVADTNETVLLTIAQPFPNHNGGMVEFGPDGFLYIGMGDGGSANDPGNRAQNIEERLGKILRIDVDHPNGSVPYSSPPDNPFFGPTPGADEIYALGLRNPWRFSFDRATGQLYAADVGQDAREEIDIITRGGNYGWRIFEGTRCTNLGPTSCTAGGFIAPIAEYTHSAGRCSITGGYVYRGAKSSLPVGAYVYGDYCTGEIFMLRDGAQSLLLDTSLSISSFGEDEAGEIYVVGLGGTVHRIAAPNPLASVSAASFNGAALAAESIVSAFGTGLATTTQSGGGTSLGGTTVRVVDSAGTERPAFIFFVSPSQANFQIPPGTTAGAASVNITASNGVVSSQTAQIAAVAPGLFAANANGQGVAAALALRVKPDNSQTFEPVAFYDTAQGRYASRPLDLGPETDQVFLVLFGTGIRFRSSLSAVTATIGGVDAQVTFAGAQGQFVGLDQVNLRVPRSLIGRGEIDVALMVDGKAANIVNVNIH